MAALVGHLAQLPPMNHVGEAQDIAYVIPYLAPEPSRYVTRHILPLNGGSSMPW